MASNAWAYVVRRVVTADSAREAVRIMRAVPGVLHVRSACDQGNGTYVVTLDLVK